MLLENIVTQAVAQALIMDMDTEKAMAIDGVMEE